MKLNLEGRSSPSILQSLGDYWNPCTVPFLELLLSSEINNPIEMEMFLVLSAISSDMSHTASEFLGFPLVEKACTIFFHSNSFCPMFSSFREAMILRGVERKD
ncbi:hypothetical protein BVRB_4g097160 [Beta vulgaris subsp. vulgaris]|uniref:Uncharacterized protein n=1 Tax=Beta vulgaris subsp. vulgaris TaxID=3555 RepID=A0A0J8BDA9_BETVV|nr:hypothetical protein BVRB_4g097160 [Beta vulgaris subsp. vulgaris]